MCPHQVSLPQVTFSYKRQMCTSDTQNSIVYVMIILYIEKSITLPFYRYNVQLHRGEGKKPKIAPTEFETSTMSETDNVSPSYTTMTRMCVTSCVLKNSTLKFHSISSCLSLTPRRNLHQRNFKNFIRISK